MNANGRTSWRVTGVHAGTCNCIWSCPCQFNALPDKGYCEAILAWQINDGHFGETSLDGVRFGFAVHWPGAIHEGNGTRQCVVDERATDEQRKIMEELLAGKHGGAYFEVFSVVCPNDRDPISAPIELEVDREARHARLSLGGVGESSIQPIVNPEIGPDEHRVRIDLPNGFEYKQAEIANSVSWTVASGDPLAFSHENTYAQLYEFDWSNA